MIELSLNIGDKVELELVEDVVNQSWVDIAAFELPEVDSHSKCMGMTQEWLNKDFCDAVVLGGDIGAEIWKIAFQSRKEAGQTWILRRKLFFQSWRVFRAAFWDVTP